MSDLISSLEALSGPSREVDVEIARLIGLEVSHLGHYSTEWPPHFTKSIDAAISAVPREALWRVGHQGDEAPERFEAIIMPLGPNSCGNSSSPAIALMIAILRARETKGK